MHIQTEFEYSQSRFTLSLFSFGHDKLSEKDDILLVQDIGSVLDQSQIASNVSEFDSNFHFTRLKTQSKTDITPRRRYCEGRRKTRKRGKFDGRQCDYPARIHLDRPQLDYCNAGDETRPSAAADNCLD